MVPGSVKWDAPSVDLRFTMQDGKAQVAVHSRGAPPQMFRDGIGVVVEGRYSASGTFEATNLMVKHSNEYKPPKAGQQPEEMYKTLMKGARVMLNAIGSSALLVALAISRARVSWPRRWAAGGGMTAWIRAAYAAAYANFALLIIAAARDGRPRS